MLTILNIREKTKFLIEAVKLVCVFFKHKKSKSFIGLFWKKKQKPKDLGICEL